MFTKAHRLVAFFVLAIVAVAVPLACSSSDSGSDGATDKVSVDMTRAG